MNILCSRHQYHRGAQERREAAFERALLASVCPECRYTGFMKRFLLATSALLVVPTIFFACSGGDEDTGSDPSQVTPGTGSTMGPGATDTASGEVTAPMTGTPTDMPTQTADPTMTAQPTMTAEPTMTAGGGGMPGAGGSGMDPGSGAGMGGMPAAAGNCVDLTASAPAALPPVQIAELAPGQHIMLYNQSDSAVPLDTLQFCANFGYETASNLTEATSIEPGAYLKLEWFAALDDLGVGEAEGEMLMFIETLPIPLGSSDILDYVCWGAGAQGRRTEGMMVYPGDCLGAMENGALQRLPMTSGTDAASYDVAATPSTGDCIEP